VTRSTALLLCAITLLFAAFGAAGANSAVGSRSLNVSLEESVLAELNDVRAEHGLRPLKLNRALTAAARAHTFEMVSEGYFEHESSNGAPFWKRVEGFYKPGQGRWQVGENLIWCSPSIRARTAVELWMGSAEHRQNILSRAWREIGIAAVYASSSTGAYGGGPVTVITTDFGVR
jgi:uncharacterized protein YkwD